MFHKLKQFKDLRNQAKNIQNTLSQQQIEIDKNGIKLVMDGNQNIISLTIDPNLNTQQIESIIPAVVNEAIKKVQRTMVETMKGLKGIENFKF